MKKFLLLLFILGGLSATAQKQKAEPLKDNKEAPYLKYPDLPAFDAVYLNGKDTFSTYNIPKGKPVLIIYFSPDCDHCKKMFDDLLPQMEKIKNVDVYVMSFMPLVAMRIFNGTYHLERYDNIKFIGQDHKIFFPGFYGISSVPAVVLYDKNKKLAKFWPNEVTMDQVLAETKKL
jgi:thioredoxin-related protein